MTDDKKKRLIEFAEEHLQSIVEDALHDYGHWDGEIEFGEITVEDWEWITDNCEATVRVNI